MPEPILSASNLETFYGPIKALSGVSLDIPEGGITAVIGANGAGKTSLLKTISGALAPQKGDILWQGQTIQGLSPDKISRLGIAHVPEGREVFPLLTVRENLLLGAYQLSKRIDEDLHNILDLFPILKSKLKCDAGLLSGGQQQMLALGRALMQKPKILLLDEPSLGLAPALTQEIFTILQKLNGDQGLTMVLVEQNAKVALDICHRGLVLELGRVVLEGDRETLKNHPDIKEFYLGGRDLGIRGRKRWKKKKSWS